MQPVGVEFQIIRQYFERHACYDASVALGIGDDCALIQPTPGLLQAISVDTSIAGRHFPDDASACDIAYRSLTVSLSDLAAMGATARWFTLAISLPEIDRAWLDQFSQGLFAAAQNAGVQLVGGDTTKGPLAITIQVQGEVPMGKALLRSGAKANDHVYVSGCLGDAGAGLAVYRKTLPANAALLQAYLRPEPELQLGLQLPGKASSCIDVSDGLLADLSHILRASGVGAEIDLAAIPLSQALLAVMDREQALELALTAGDDYRLCFTSALSPQELGIQGMYCIGRIITEPQLRLANQPPGLQLERTGFDHFHD